jgi:hypothetical protein
VPAGPNRDQASLPVFCGRRAEVGHGRDRSLVSDLGGRPAASRDKRASTTSSAGGIGLAPWRRSTKATSTWSARKGSSLMSLKRNLLRTSLGTLLPLLAACSADPGEPGSGWTETSAAQSAPFTFEEYRETARTHVDGHDVFLVEGDMLFENEAALRSYFDDLNATSTDKSIINKVGGVADKRPNPTNIRFCFAAGWGQNQGTYTAPALAGVKTSILSAMTEWELTANIKFTWRSDLDGSACNNNGANPGVDFVVDHWNSSGTATGAFPSLSWANQKLRVPTSGIGHDHAVHEVGHILGFRHEHIQGGDPDPDCQEDNNYISLTEFDTLSVMKYANCASGSKVINGGSSPSALDATGAHKIYGPTVDNSLYILQDAGLWRTDNDDGVYKHAGNPAVDWSGATSAARLSTRIYVIQADHLHKVNPADGTYTVLGGPAWPGQTTMAVINSAIYITQDAGLWKITSTSTGAFTQVGSADWTGATSMAAHGASLYIIQADHLHKVNPADGTYTVLGGAAWPGITTMASVGGNLYITQDAGLWRITNLTTGAYTQVGTADWTGASAMTALGSKLYITQADYLHRVEPSTGAFTVLGGAAWPGASAMTAMP